MSQGQKRYRTIRLVLFAMLWLILFLLSVKVSAGWATKSLSILSESFYTLVTGFSALLSLLAVTTIDRPTGKHIYGHGLRETLLTLLLVAGSSNISLGLLWLSSQQLIAAWYGEEIPFTVDVTASLFQLLGVTVAVSLILGLIGIFQGRSLRNPALSFNGKQLLKDGALTLLVIGGFAGIWWGLIWLDLLLPIVLVLLTIVNLWQVIKWQLPLLVKQTAIAPEILAEIACQVNGVTQCYQIRSRGIVGRLVYISMHIVIHPDFHTVTTVIAERIEEDIRERFGPVQVTFYIDDDSEEEETWISLDSSAEVNGRIG